MMCQGVWWARNVEGEGEGEREERRRRRVDCANFEEGEERAERMVRCGLYSRREGCW